MITEIYKFGVFLVQKRPFRDTQSAFQKKKALETTIFIVFFVCTLFGPSCQKREILDTQPKKKKIFTDNWKSSFLSIFCFFLVFLFFFFSLFVFVGFVVFVFFLEGLRVMWGGPKGHLTWP